MPPEACTTLSEAPAARQIPVNLNSVSTQMPSPHGMLHDVSHTTTHATRRRLPQLSPRQKSVLRVLALLPPLAFGLTMLLLDRYGQTDRARAAGAIVVLGAGVNAYGLPGPSLRARTLHAVELYKRGLAPKIIFTGGVGHNPPAESHVAAALAVRRGVPQSATLTEETSTTTWQNVGNAVALCRKHGIRDVIVVSDPYHLWRARRNFAAHGITAYPSPTRNRETWLRVLMTARETFSVARDVLFLRH
jgi:uncharacterized SAM-binding protein YcdF (DUF218 family)